MEQGSSPRVLIGFRTQNSIKRKLFTQIINMLHFLCFIKQKFSRTQN